MRKKNLVALFHALSGAAGILVSLFSKGQIRLPEQPVKSVGFTIFGLGGLLFAYAVAYLRGGFEGNVDPVTEDLVTEGPYRFVRHPLYLAMLVMCMGLAIGLRSICGLAMTVLVFFPLCIYRARLEEEALELRFGKEWRDYSDRTDFIIPFVY
ncbi:MAG: isoprenylcysteine carboxylmethyltransferase family protein [Anaerolineae bacterium]|jgi:protein-S-isoprenylcysteine O-methyltransferase Ste14